LNPNTSSRSADQSVLLRSVLRLDHWLDTMRSPETPDSSGNQKRARYRGYGGPVVHWWQNCLQYTGAGLDWRYEGIIAGYLTLFDATQDIAWLEKATRAADDLVSGQLPDGGYANSAFENNPHPHGTPHEAAADIGLLLVAAQLRARQDQRWEHYREVAQRNLDNVFVAKFWDPQRREFGDQIGQKGSSFVPNKLATLAEAFFLLARLTDDDRYAQYAMTALDAVIALQIKTGKLEGAVYQNQLQGRAVRKLLPYYIARCIPGLLDGYHWSGEERYLQAALLAGKFIASVRFPDGSLPQVVYETGWLGGRVNRYPQWVSPLGDVLRGWEMLKPFGFEIDCQPTYDWLLSGQFPNGGIATGRRFGSQVSQRKAHTPPDFRDLIVCCGWADKAFRYLAEKLTYQISDISPVVSVVSLPNQDQVQVDVHESACMVRGKEAVFRETDSSIEITRRGETLYQWVKGEDWAQSSSPALLWK
jgi:hypothetical protein